MIKKLLQIIPIIVLLLFLTACTGDPYTANNYFIFVYTEGDDSEVNFDLLVKRTDFESQILDTISPAYISEYPNYINHDYLDPTDEYISFCAYVTTGGCFEDYTWTDDVSFDGIRSLEKMTSIKLVMFDDDGNTLQMTEAFRLKRYNIDYMERVMSFTVDMDTEEIAFSQQIFAQTRLRIMLIFSSVIIFLGSGINVLFSLIIDKDAKVQGLFYLTSVLGYYLIALSFYLLPFTVYYMSWKYFIVLILGAGIQFGLVYWKWGKYHSWKRILLAVSLSSLFTILLSIMFYFQGYSL